jgi:hypothetical protein
MNVSDVTRWARLGARERLTHLADEAAGIYRAFPELRSHTIGFGRRADTAAAHAGRRRMFPASGRKRISDADA